MSNVAAQVQERAANWLPIPGVAEKARRRQAEVDEDDLFTKGTVASFYPREGRGIIRNDRDETLPFSVPESAIVGDPAHIEEGSRIGYDASVTQGGMKVTVLKVY